MLSFLISAIKPHSGNGDALARRGWVEPDRERAERIMMEDGRIVSLQEATAKGAIHEAEQPVGNKRHSTEDVAARAGGGRDGTLQAPQVWILCWRGVRSLCLIRVKEKARA